ncbi:MAG: BON domain-containing protein [Pirellulaceae bacterium]|nr:BON domain-containing protein [Pirellulaceae bacterium]
MSQLSSVTAYESDANLKQQIGQYLSSLQMQALRQVRIVVRNGTVILRGEVQSFYQKQLLLTCRTRVPGVQGLVDEVRVKDVARAVPA